MNALDQQPLNNGQAVIRAQRCDVVDDNPGIQVSNGTNERPFHDLNPDHLASFWVQAEKQRPAATGRFAFADFFNQTASHQFTGNLRNRRVPKAATPGNINSGKRTLALNQIQNDIVVQGTHQVVIASSRRLHDFLLRYPKYLLYSVQFFRSMSSPFYLFN